MKIGDRVKVIDSGKYSPPSDIECIEYAIVKAFAMGVVRVTAYMRNEVAHPYDQDIYGSRWFYPEELIVICQR